MEENNVRFVKLAWGEEVISEFSIVDGKMKLVNPIVLVPNHQGGVEARPWCPLSSERVFILEPSDVSFANPVVDEVENKYKEMHSQIVLPDNKIQLNG